MTSLLPISHDDDDGSKDNNIDVDGYFDAEL